MSDPQSGQHVALVVEDDPEVRELAAAVLADEIPDHGHFVPKPYNGPPSSDTSHR